MYAEVIINKCEESDAGTELYITVPDKKLAEILNSKYMKKAEIRFDDGRTISAEQRKKAYATIRDISEHTGYAPEEQKQWLKILYVLKTEREYISLSDCSMDEAREFINVILDHAIENGIQLKAEGISRTDDIGKYLYSCIKHRKCAVCGVPGEIHHEDTIGMGNDRRKTDDSNYRKICLCRKHHTIAHQMGRDRFQKAYKVYGIVVNDG